MKELSPNAKEKLIEDFIIKWLLEGSRTRREFYRKENLLPLWTIVFDMTNWCNLRCEGC